MMDLSDADLSQAVSDVQAKPIGQAQVVGTVADNPDKAAQAVNLAGVTGAHPEVVYNDLDNYKTSVKAQAASSIVQSNPTLGGFVSSPMAARASNDDLGTLDTVSQHVQTTAAPSLWSKLYDYIKPDDFDKALGEGFGRGFDVEGQRKDYEDLYNYSDSPAWKALAGGIGGAVANLGNMALHLPGAVIEAGSAGIAELYKEAGGEAAYKATLGKFGGEGSAAGLQEGLAQAAQVGLPEMVGEGAAAHAQSVMHDQGVAFAHSIAELFLREGKAPPTGVSPILDQIHAAQNAKDLASLNAALGEAQNSLLRKRSPEMFSEFIRHHGDQTIGINADAIAELHQGVPQAGVGPLGFVPDLPAQMLRSAVTGQDIKISHADWLTHVDPAVAAALEPHIRTRPGNVTVAELEAIQSKTPEPTPDPVFPKGRGMNPDTLTYLGKNADNEDVWEARPKDAYTRPKRVVLDAEGNSKIESNTFKAADRDAAWANEESRDERFIVTQPKAFEAEALAQHGYEDEPVETIDGAAIKIGNKLYRGSTHSEALDRAAKDHNISPEAFIDQLEGQNNIGLDGFITSEGRFVTRKEAYEIQDKLDATKAMPGIEDTLREQAGLPQDVPKSAYERALEKATNAQRVNRPAPTDGSVNWLVHEGDGDKLLMERADGIDYYANVGRATDAHEVIEQLHTSVPNLSDLENANTNAMKGVLKHVGADKVPTYVGDRSNPAVQNNLGMYWGNSDAIVLRDTGNLRQMLSTQVHESAHAAYMHVIENDAEVKDVLDKLLYHARESETDPVEHGYSYDQDGERFDTNHYGLTNPHEFVSEGLSNPEFQKFLSKTKLTDDMTKDLHSFLGEIPKSKLSTMWDAMLLVARKAFGLPITEESLSLLDAVFKVSDRLTAVAGEARAAAKDGNFDQRPLAAQAPRDPFFDRATAHGMTKDQAVKYADLIAKQREEAAQARNAEVLKEEQHKQSVEWKTNEVQVRKEATETIRNRRDVAAERTLNGRAKLDTDALSAEQQTALAGSHERGGELDPQGLATNLGYDSVDEMTSEVKALRDDRGTARPVDYQRKLVATETEKQMQARFGDQRENAIQAAKERILSETQMDLIQAETSAAGNPFTKAQLQANMKEVIAAMKVSEIDSSASMDAAGKAARAIEGGFLNKDPAEAFAQRMRQQNALIAAKQMLEVEKAKGQFDKLMKRYSAREIIGASQEYVDQIHGVMLKLGLPVKRSVQDIEASLAKSGHDSFGAFVDQKQGDFRDLFVPDWLRDDSLRTKVDDLTVEQFQDLHKAMKAMTFNARDELKVIRSGEKADFHEVRDEMVASLKALGPPKQLAGTIDKRSISNRISHAWWSMINMEKLLSRIDRGDRSGVFTQTLTRQYTEAANYKERLVKEYADKLSGLTKIDGYNDHFDNKLFVDPTTGDFIPMQRKHVLGVLQNVGNPGNMQKLAAGYKLEPKQVMDWLHQNTSKEDWDRAQGIGDLFKELHERADTMSRNVSGVGVDTVPISKIDTPHGTYDGWYNPVKYSEYLLGKSKALLSTNLESEGYYRANTPQSYAKSRTAYIAPMDLSMDVIPQRMQQVIHDIAMRPTVIQLNKFFTDAPFRQAFKSHFGPAQDAQLTPFLRDLANAPNFQSESASVFNGFLREMSGNMVNTLIGFNPKTVMKHGTTALVKSAFEGRADFAREMTTMFSRQDTGASDWSMALEKSDELNRRGQNWQELVQGTGQNLSLRGASNSRYQDMRSVMAHIGAKPIATFDMMSSVPLWLATYKRMIAEGHDEGQAVFHADADVRDTHGSSILTNKPQATRNVGPVAQTFASLYGFFSENLQKQYELAWRSKDSFEALKGGDWDTWKQNIPKIASLAFTSILIPALIEEGVTSSTSDNKESFGKHAANVMVNGLTSSFIGIRDVAQSLTSGYQPGGGMISTMEKSVVDPANDIKGMIKDLSAGKGLTTQRKGQLIKHAFTLTGLATGLTNSQEGRSLEYAYRYFHNEEHPKDPWQTAVGLINGQTRRK